MRDFQQKVVVITGGGGGIGAAMAGAFAARGARIVLADLDEAAMRRSPCGPTSATSAP
jgi:NAD(P)-dependent dehydrogenase (short-subunit alcohol dehydrogenase family)